MARQRSRQRSFNRSRASPNRDWHGTNSTVFTTVAPATKVLFAGISPSNPGIDETILRTVGVVAVASDQAAADEQQIGAFGIVPVTDLAFAAGAASVPGPITDSSDDGWYVYVPFAQLFAFADATGFVSNKATIYQFDSRAKRILAEGTTMALMFENASASFGFNIAVNFRTLSMVRGTG